MYRLWVVTILCACFAFYVTNVEGQNFIRPDRVSDIDIESIIRGIELRSNLFRSSMDSALTKSRFNSRREDHLKLFIKDFDEQTKLLRDHFEQHSLITSDVELLLDRAAPIDDFMTRNRFSSEAQNDWTKLRNKLDRLALAYGIRWSWDTYHSEDQTK